MAHRYFRHVAKIDILFFFFFPLHIFLCREHSWLLAAHSHSRELPTHHFIWDPVTFPVAPLRCSMPHFLGKCFCHHSCVHQPLSWLTFPLLPLIHRWHSKVLTLSPECPSHLYLIFGWFDASLMNHLSLPLTALLCLLHFTDFISTHWELVKLNGDAGKNSFVVMWCSEFCA